MLCQVLCALLVASCAAQRWDVQSFQGPNEQSVTINYSQSQCFGLARRSRQVQVQIPTLYNIKTKQISPIPQALYNADQTTIARLESDGWVVRNRRVLLPQLTYERVPVCCPWDQNCDQNQPIQDSPSVTANSPCLNGGQLIFEDGQSRCRCPRGYVGKMCQIPENSQTVAPITSSGPTIPVTSTYGRYGDMAVQDAEIQRQQTNNVPAMQSRENAITGSYAPWAQQAALWHQEALRAKFAQLEELYRRTQAFNVKGYPAFQSVSSRATPWLRSIPRQGFNVPQRVPGRGYNIPQAVPSRFNVPQRFYGRGYNIPQIVPGRVSTVAQPIPGRGFNVPNFFPRRDFYVPQPIRAKEAKGPQPVRAKKTNYPQPVHARVFYNPNQILGRVSNAPQPFPIRDSAFLQYIPSQSSPNLKPVGMTAYPQRENQRGQNTFNQISLLKSMINKRISSMKPRSDSQNRNPYSAIISPGQLPPGMIQAAYAIRQELQQQERAPGNPYSSNLQDMPYTNSMANRMQGDQPPQGSRVPEARTPWDLDPFGQQQNPVFMNDPRASRVRTPEVNKDRQILALAVYKHILNQQRARLAAGSPIKSVNSPMQSQDQNNIPNQVPQSQQPNGEQQQSPATYDVTQMRQCLANVETKFNACFQTYDVTIEQFMSPLYIEKSRKVCQNGNTVGQCFQGLEMVCGEAAASTTRPMVSSVLRTMTMVCQEIMARAPVGSQAIPVEPPVEPQTTQQKTEVPQEQQQLPAQGQQDVPTPEEQQQMMECQKVLEPMLNDCLKDYDITIDQFMNPQYIIKAQALCEDNTAVGQCIMQMEKACGDNSQKTTKKMIHSILGMMGMVCKKIQERGGDNKVSPTSGEVPIKDKIILEEKAPIEEPPMSKTIQQQPESGVPPQNQSQRDAQGERPKPTQEEQIVMQKCQPVLQNKLNECIQQHGVTIQEFINPDYIEKARKVCQDSIAVGQCLRQLDKTCGEDTILITRKVLTSILQMMGMVCQQIQARGESLPQQTMAPATAGPNTHDDFFKKPTNAVLQEKETTVPPQQQAPTQGGQDELSVPTQEEQQLMQQCQPVLQNKLNECLQQHGVTVQEFINPEHIEKSRQVCQDSSAVSQCILQLDKTCGETATVTTRKMLTTILKLMGTVCQKIQAIDEQNKPNVPVQSVQEQQGSKADQAQSQGNSPHNGEHIQPTQDIETLKKCQSSLEPRLNECLKGHSLTIEQFVNPEFLDKSRALCKDSSAVRECIMKLDTVCGQDTVDTTRKMIQSILNMMGGICQNIMSLGEQGIPPSNHGLPRGPLLRSGGMPPNTPAQSKGNVVKSPVPNLTSKQESVSQDSVPSADGSNDHASSQQDINGASAKASTGQDTAQYMSRDLEIFGYPLWLIITLILILAVLLLLFVMVTCLCVRRRRRQKKVVITKEIEKMPIPVDEKMCTVGMPPPSYTTTAVQQNEDGLALPPLDLGEDSVSVNLDESFNEKPPLYEDETAADKEKN